MKFKITMRNKNLPSMTNEFYVTSNSFTTVAAYAQHYLVPSMFELIKIELVEEIPEYEKIFSTQCTPSNQES